MRARGGRTDLLFRACAGGSGRSPATTRGSTGRALRALGRARHRARAVRALGRATRATGAPRSSPRRASQPVDARGAAAAGAVDGDRPFERLVGAEPLALAARRAEAGEKPGVPCSSPGERRARAQHHPPPPPQDDAHAAREVVLGAEDRPALRGHGHGQDVRAPRAASPSSRTAQRACARGGATRRRRPRRARPRRAARAHDPAAGAHDQGGRRQRAAEAAARERRHRAVAEGRLAPPPVPGEGAAPVLLGVGAAAAEGDRLASEHRLPRTRAPSRCGCQYCGSPGTTCATPSAPRRARGHAARPSSVASSRASGPRSTASRRSVRAAPPCRRGPRRPRRARRVRRPGRRGAPAHEAAGVGGERDDGPRSVRRAADAAQRDDAAPAGRVAKPPVVALHRHPVGAPRIAERGVGPGPAIGGEDPAHAAGGRLTSYGSQSRFQNASSPCSRMYASSLRWIGYTPWMLTGSASPTSMPR